MLDEYQYRAVKERRNTVVTAGAGSGKTTVLAERFLDLIASGEAEVDGILTLTFTRKAAAEMYERIHRLLLERADEEKDGRVRERLQRAVENFAEASISTLDSFCAQVLRGGSERFGIPADFQLEQGAAGDPAGEAALEFMLTENADPALERYVGIFGFSRVLGQLFTPFAAQELHIASAGGYGEIPQQLAEWCNREAEERVKELEELRPHIEQAEGESAWVQKLRAGIAQLPDLRELAEAERWGTLAQALENAGLSTNGRVKKPHLVELNDRVIAWNEAVEQLRQVLAVPVYESDYRGLYRLLDRFREHYLQRKRESGLLSFRDVVEAAIVLLIEDLQLRDFYKRKFTHIMIDEFQDNNDLQRRLLYLLAERRGHVSARPVPESDELEPEKLFFVGDEKQSIYRFRGADVEVFQKLKQEFPAGEDGESSLLINYRSHRGLVSFFNTLFARVMDPQQAAADYEARYAPVRWKRGEEALSPRITLFYKPYRKEQDPEHVDGVRAEAWHVCRSIRRLVAEEGLQISDGKGGSRPCGYGDIAVLMRSTGNQIHYERYLRRLGVPYTVQGTRSLFLDAPVYDLYHLLQLIVYPDDRLAYAALLRSPLVNLSDLTLTRLLRDSGEAFEHRGEEELFPDEQDREKYRRAREMYLDCAGRARSASIGELLRAIWYEYGYRYAVLRNPDHHPYLEFYDTLQEYARLYEGRGEGLVAFLDFLRQNLGQFEKVEETGGLPGRAEGVQILSIHRSKGLEFPVVFVVDTGNTGRQGGSEFLYTPQTPFGPVITWGDDGTVQPNVFMRRAKDEEEQRDLAELKRLFYVACTRAEDHLFISGFHHSRNRNDGETGGGRKAMLNMLLRALGWQGSNDELETEELAAALGGGIEVEEIPDVTENQILGGSSFSKPRDPSDAAAAYRSAAGVERRFRRRDYSAVDFSAVRPAAGSAADFASADTAEAADSEVLPEAGRKTAAAGGEPLPAFASDRFLRNEEEVRAFGTLAHARIAEALDPRTEATRMPPALAEKPEEERRAIEEEARQIAGRFLQSELGRRASAGRCECELPFLLRHPGDDREAYVRGQIDLLLEEEKEVIVCDFKTDRRKHPELHVGQLAVYRRAAEELYGKPVRTLLCYLRGMETAEPAAGELPPLPEGHFEDSTG
jgi:ATP-dependent exoDNAse (exonuclease V) beta subunit